MSAFESYFSTQLGQFFKKIMSCMPVFEALKKKGHPYLYKSVCLMVGRIMAELKDSWTQTHMYM